MAITLTEKQYRLLRDCIPYNRTYLDGLTYGSGHSIQTVRQLINKGVLEVARTPGDTVRVGLTDQGVEVMSSVEGAAFNGPVFFETAYAKLIAPHGYEAGSVVVDITKDPILNVTIVGGTSLSCVQNQLSAMEALLSVIFQRTEGWFPQKDRNADVVVTSIYHDSWCCFVRFDYNKEQVKVALDFEDSEISWGVSVKNFFFKTNKPWCLFQFVDEVLEIRQRESDFLSKVRV